MRSKAPEEVKSKREKLWFITVLPCPNHTLDKASSEQKAGFFTMAA